MVGERIKSIRESKGITINELAHVADISKSYISSIERGIQKNPSINVLEKIAAALGVSLDILLDSKNSDINLEDDWVKLLKEAIGQGLTKEEFIQFTMLMGVKRKKASFDSSHIHKKKWTI
ncbi:helix-turn-helix domain-containing protein [Rossellomorea vietnamensis]|uniref:Helix-turn-helix domain-containing protein n=1 Tax=Rossellomorea aquimaris TaxID=189382 RepID=A0A5D4TUJ8_9BACI|nr:helix-turn-helix domain-containing protein [Rossellomorea aquimaris]TYS78438.1 helix-turn-helix domain-containing protein [Rossellomorea aquimaris]